MNRIIVLPDQEQGFGFFFCRWCFVFCFVLFCFVLFFCFVLLCFVSIFFFSFCPLGIFLSFASFLCFVFCFSFCFCFLFLFPQVRSCYRLVISPLFVPYAWPTSYLKYCRKTLVANLLSNLTGQRKSKHRHLPSSSNNHLPLMKQNDSRVKYWKRWTEVESL